MMANQMVQQQVTVTNSKYVVLFHQLINLLLDVYVMEEDLRFSDEIH